MRVWCVLALLVVVSATPQADLSTGLCRCTTKPLPGFQNASCACLDSRPSTFYDSVLSLGSLLSTSTVASVAPVTTDETCICSVDGAKGYAGSCTCEAVLEPCPMHTSGHPRCWPDTGFRANVKWDQAAEEYVLQDPASGAEIEKLSEVECGDTGRVGTWPDCQCADGLEGLFQWDSRNLQWSNNCTVVPCPSFADGEPFCKCSTGYVESTENPILWNATTEKWDGSCTKVHCPEGTLSGSHPECPCKKGYSGRSVFTDGLYTHNCSLAACILNSEHDGSNCICKAGYYSSDASPLAWNDESQEWVGWCSKRDCPDNSEAHAKCDCSRGFIGAVSWNASSRHYDGKCVAVDCPAHASGDGCSCHVGYIHTSKEGATDDFDVVGRVWTHSCVARGCPEGSGSSNPATCRCNAPGYSGALAWTGSEWGSCIDEACPLHSGQVLSEDGTRGCVCNVGYHGQVTWQSETSNWVSTCEEAECQSPKTCNLDTFTAECSTGYSGSVTWDTQTESWVSTCARVDCPIGSSHHPNCKCMTGFRGGHKSTGSLFWEQNGDLSKYRGYCSAVANAARSSTSCQGATMNLSCDHSLVRIVTAFFGRNDANTCATTPQSELTCSSANALSIVHTRCDGRSSCEIPATSEEFGDPCKAAEQYLTVEYECVDATQQICDDLCTDVACPENSSPNLDGTCSCNFGFMGSIHWENPFYKGECVPASCPTNATGLGPDCSCPKGYLPSNDFMFTADGWIGECNQQSCGPYTKYWPNCECIDNHHYANGIPIIWDASHGFTGSCVPWPCPQNASPPGSCFCNRGFATSIENELAVAPLWDTHKGEWAHHCEYIPCGTGSDPSTHPLCSCSSGYSGYPEWHSSSGEYDSCTEVACPVEGNMQKMTDTNAPWAAPVTTHSCMCKNGYSGAIDFDVTLQQWSGTCLAAECPSNADCSDELVVRCADGFYGTVDWSGESATEGFWDVNCEEVPCPEHAEDAPHCTCRPGFAGGRVQWSNANNWTTACQAVECPAGATKDLAGTCSCDKGYAGSIEWNSTVSAYSGNCTLEMCVPHASGEPRCTCDRGFRPSVDYMFSNDHWQGRCEPVPCPVDTDSSKNCSCKMGFQGTVSWNMANFEFDGECTYIGCPPDSFGSNCTCASGYSGIGMWDGESWTHTCHARVCPEGTIQIDLGKGHTCKCPIRTHGSPRWTGTEWEAHCTPVDCPEHSMLDAKNGSKCDCKDGYAGYPLWNPSTMAFTSDCKPVPCPEGMAGAGGPNGCYCPPGELGNCTLDLTIQEFDCNCEPRDCPVNAQTSEITDLCACKKGYSGILEWDAATKNYSGSCVKRNCTEDVPNSAGHPSCACTTGYRGAVFWDYATGRHVGQCEFVSCPAFTDTHPLCSVLPKYRYKENQTVTWSPESGQWQGAAEPIPCPGNAHGAPDCVCEQGYRDSGITVQGQEYLGSCDPVPCPGDHSGFPQCACDVGYKGSMQWDTVTTNGNWVSTCSIAQCPENSHTPTVCTCNDGYRGNREWNATTQAWTHQCQKIFCPPHSENHPGCKCMSGYIGTINYSTSTGYSGNCKIVACPANSKRIGGTVEANSDGLIPLSHVASSAVLTIKHVSGDIKTFVEVINDEHWAKVIQWKDSYTPQGSKFGFIATANSDDAKLSDEEINRLSGSDGTRTYMIDWDATQKGEIPRKLFITTSLAHVDGSSSFGIIGNETRASLSMSSPQHDTILSSYTTNHIDSAASLPVLTSTSDCYRLIMGSDNSFDCQSSPGKRCISGGSACTTGDEDFPVLRNVRVYVKLDPSLTVYQSVDDAHLVNSALAVVESSIPGCECHIGFSGGFGWVDTHYQGSCVHVTCPSSVDCSALIAQPDTDQVIHPAAKGYRGHAIWKGTEWDIASIHKVDCPAETTGYPDCHCKHGYEGFVDWSTFESNSSIAVYTENCNYVNCPTLMMVRGESGTGLPKCTCPIGFTGVATWDATRQSFAGAPGCTVADCATEDMTKSDDRTTCTCPVGFKGSMTFDNTTQKYVGSSSCEPVLCPMGASCDTNPEERNCLEFYSGRYHWDYDAQEWEHNCQMVECTNHAQRRPGESVNGCICQVGWQPSASWLPETQSYSGCNQLVSCPANADTNALSTETSGRACTCPPGYFGFPTWHASQATYTHTCTRRPCPEGSARFQGNLCQCEVGFHGGLTWDQISQDYEGSCQIAPCPNIGVNCTYATDSANRQADAALPCNTAYHGSAVWNAAIQAWDDRCFLRPCPADTSVLRDSRSGCVCRWGYQGQVIWNSQTADYDHNCTQVDCPTGTERRSDGYCACPIGTSAGLNRFLEDGKWISSCGAVLKCPQHSEKGPHCTCDQGYSGQVALNTHVTSAAQSQTAAIEVSSFYSGSCEDVPCPANSLENSFPQCECGNGFSGNMTWIPSTQTWTTECQVAQCPQFASDGPSCACDRGYIGELYFDRQTQTWNGTCRPATCPEHATPGYDGTEPTCNCNNGFRGHPIWVAGDGWKHECVEVACPDFSDKVVATTAISYQRIDRYVGCHKEGNALGFLGHPVQLFEDVTSHCTGGVNSEECVNLAKQSCERLIASGRECWGFAVANGRKIMLYNSAASDYSICDPENGLLENSEFTTFKRRSAIGDCRCKSGYGGGFIFMGTKYVGACSLDSCPSHSSCDTSVTCNQGYFNATSFTWDYDTENWEGECSRRECGEHDNPDTFPACACATGYAGGEHGWDFATESWTGTCSKVDCPENTDMNHPNCKCITGFLRNDDVPNQSLGWFGDEWKHTCDAVPCPGDSSRVAGGNCKCDTGFKGHPSFSIEYGNYTVAGSGNLNACTRVECPSNSIELIRYQSDGSQFPSCHCKDGYHGDLTWKHSTFSWGTCTAALCPVHSSGHPYCTCDRGYAGELVWDGVQFSGECDEMETIATWKVVPSSAIEHADCQVIRGASTSSVSIQSNPLQLVLDFAGNADTVNVIRCDITLPAEFTKLRGSLGVGTTVGTAENNAAMAAWNSTRISETTRYIAVGTMYNVVDPGMEGGSVSKTYTSSIDIAVPQTAVTQTNTIRLEASQPAGVILSLDPSNLETYSLPSDVVTWIRTTNIQT